MIKIEGYLTQQKLEDTLKQIIPKEDWLGREVRVPDTRMRWDMSFRLHNKTYVVEFDGYQHYQSISSIENDEKKDNIATELSFKTIRIPYFVQLTTQTLHHYFGIEGNIDQDFPHGFIDKKAYLPACYCKLGYARYEDELDKLPTNIVNDIKESLENWCKVKDRRFVY